MAALRSRVAWSVRVDRTSSGERRLLLEEGGTYGQGHAPRVAGSVIVVAQHVDLVLWRMGVGKGRALDRRPFFYSIVNDDDNDAT